MTSISLRDLADQLSGSVFFGKAQENDVQLCGVASIDEATKDQVTFYYQDEYRSMLLNSEAGAVIIGAENPDCPAPQIIVDNPYLAFARAAKIFSPPRKILQGVHATAIVHESAKIDPTAYVGPYCIIEERCEIGAGTQLHAHVHVGPECLMGRDCDLYPQVALGYGTRIGSRVTLFSQCTLGCDGFGFIPTREGIDKIPQLGIVEIHDDVEIGSHTSIDRATTGKTVVGEGTKIDNNVHLAHNVKIGKHCMICGSTAIAGSATLKDRVVCGGGARVGNRVVLGDGVRLAAMAGATRSLHEAGDYGGFPAVPISDWRRSVASLRRIPQLRSELRELSQSRPS